MTHLCPAEIPAPSHSGTHDRIGTGKQDMETVHVPGYTAVYHFGTAGLLLDDQEWMFCFVAYG